MTPHIKILLAALAFVSLAACKEETAAPEALRQVRSIIAAPDDVHSIVTQTGEVVPRSEVAMSFKVGGRMVMRNVDVGATVAEGDVLAVIDPRDIENEVRVAEAEVDAAKAALITALSHLERQQRLLERGVVAKAAVEVAESDWQAATSRLQAAEARLAAARDQLSYTELRATEAGIVTRVAAEPGEVISAGQPILHVAARGEREAAFDVTERSIGGAKPGLRVDVALLSSPDVATTGFVREVSPIADPVTRTYRVLVTLPEAPEQMTLGATVEGSVALDLPGVFILPASALTSEKGSPAVYVVDEATGTIRRKAVVVARYEEGRVLIASGLAADERVVAAGVSKLRPGQAVARMEDAK
jgi:RND family efflux transporter MFP subunit